MNFSEAINAHMKWVNIFLGAIERKEQLDHEHIALDNACALGKWLHDEMHRHADCPAFAHLKHCHAEFHRQACEIAKMINANNPEVAQKMLSSTGVFYRASREVVLAMETFRVECDETSNA